MNIRTAIVNPHNKLSFTEAEKLLDRVLNYLPSNYTAALSTFNNLTFKVRITGTDNAGWTLDGYVIPRLASGNMFAEEVAPRFASIHAPVPYAGGEPS